MKGANSVVSVERIEKAIFVIRDHKVMLSTHLADLYGVVPKVLVQAVKRNIGRFPKDFMFQFSVEEFENLKSQIVTSSWGGCAGQGHMHSQNKVSPCSQVFCEASEQFKCI